MLPFRKMFGFGVFAMALIADALCSIGSAQAKTGFILYTFTGANGDLGNVFELTPDGAETVLHAFMGGSDGSNPCGQLLLDANDNVYGTTNGGDIDDDGMVFRVKKH